MWEKKEVEGGVFRGLMLHERRQSGSETVAGELQAFCQCRRTHGAQAIPVVGEREKRSGQC